MNFERQLKRAAGVMHGTYLGQNVKKSKDGHILTEASFIIKKSVGVDERSIINRKYFKVYYDGGKWNGVNYQNANAPSFEAGKDYVLVVKQTTSGFKLADDKLSVYSVERDGTETVVVSQAFPEHKDIGVTKIDQFDVWVKIAYGDYLQEIQGDKYIFKPSRRKTRAPASLSETSEKNTKTNIHILWYVLILGVIGALRIRSRKSS